MAVQKPLSFAEATRFFTDSPNAVRWNFRPNTHVEPNDDYTLFDVFLYGTKIATLYIDGRVQINRRGWTSGTTRNRLNDVLIPLGWRIAVKGEQWMLRTVEGPYKSMEYRDDMIVTKISNEPKKETV